MLTAFYGTSTSSGVINPADLFIAGNVAGMSTYWLQIIRQGGALSMNISYDGINYANVLTTTLNNPTDPFNELILTGTTFETAGSSTNLDYVSIQDTPEPPSALIAVVGVGLLLWGLRKRSGACGCERCSATEGTLTG